MIEFRVSITLLNSSNSTFLFQQSFLVLKEAGERSMTIHFLKMQRSRESIHINIRLEAEKVLLSIQNSRNQITKNMFILKTQIRTKHLQFLRKNIHRMSHYIKRRPETVNRWKKVLMRSPHREKLKWAMTFNRRMLTTENKGIMIRLVARQSMTFNTIPTLKG